MNRLVVLVATILTGIIVLLVILRGCSGEARSTAGDSGNAVEESALAFWGAFASPDTLVRPQQNDDGTEESVTLKRAHALLHADSRWKHDLPSFDAEWIAWVHEHLPQGWVERGEVVNSEVNGNTATVDVLVYVTTHPMDGGSVTAKVQMRLRKDTRGWAVTHLTPTDE